MQVVTGDLIKGKKILLRLDLDVLLENGRVIDDFRLKAGLPTLKLCLENASNVVIIGHLGRPAEAGRPNGVEVPELSVAPVYQWFSEQGFKEDLESGKLKFLENLRFEKDEDEASMEFAHSIIDLVDPEDRGDVVFVNEAFAAHHPAASTICLPKLLPHFAGLRFAEEVKKLNEVRNNPKRPLVAIIGGVKIEDKGPAIEALSKFANTVLVGGKLADTSLASALPHNVLLGKLTEDGFDVTEDTLDLWDGIIKGAGEIIWNGPVGKLEDGKAQGTYKLAKLIVDSKANIIVGGGDTVGFLSAAGLLDEFENHGLPAGRQGFVSTGGGAMLKFLTDGTLPTIEALND